jgi:alanyl-tRNA synthetase
VCSSDLGSLVAPDRLRFDISHPRALAPEDIRAVEEMVNARIRDNAETMTRVMNQEEAIEAGALALFGEKYGDEVRVVSMGGEDASKGPGRLFSTELCGGTHVGRTGDIGFLKIVSEGALASGVRRIEAVVGAAALDYVTRQETLLAESAAALKAAPADLPARIVALTEDRKRQERELTELRKRLAAGGGGNGAGSGPEVREIAGVSFASRLMQDLPARELKPMADEIKKGLGSGVVALIAVNEGKASLVVGVTDNLTGRVSAIDLVRAGSQALGGKGGGGRPDMAQAGGPDGAQAQAALDAIEGALASAGQA